MATVITHTAYVSELTPEMYLQGYRSNHEHINKMAEDNVKKKYYKKNGKMRKSHPHNWKLIEPISIPQ